MKLDGIVSTLGSIVRKYQVGIYVTIIFHLIVAIALMSVKLRAVSHVAPLEIVFDFQDAEIKKLEVIAQKKQELEAEVNQLLRQTHSELRNAAVNEEWRTDNKEYNQALAENDELQRKIENTRRMMQQSQKAETEGRIKPAQQDVVSKKDLYTGPSVLSYKLAGRTAISLPVPVYQCENGGTVVVLVAVTPNGSVAAAAVDAKLSANNPCLHEAAKRAAMLSRFSSGKETANQQGSITYRFVAQ